MDSCGAIALGLLHGEYGWQGFVFAAVMSLALVVLFNELAARTLNGKRFQEAP